MRTRLFILSVFVLLAALLAFCACGTNPAGVSDASGDFESAAESSSCAPEFSDVSAESIPASSGGESETSAETSSDISDTGDTSGDASGGEEEPVLKNPDREYLATQLEEPFAVWDKLSPATVTVENPYTDNERWKLWWGETCLYTFGEGTWVYSVSGGDQIYALTLFTDGGPAVVTDRDGKTVELTQARPCALLNAEGEAIIPFGEYERLELVSSTPRIVATVSGDEAYLLDEMGQRVSERYAAVEVCRDSIGYSAGTNLLHIVGTDGAVFSARVMSDGELLEEPEHPQPSAEDISSSYVVERMMCALEPFYDALRNGDREGIEAVIGKEKYEEAVALIDTLESDYEPCHDYTKPYEEQNANKYMAWLLKNARYFSMPGIVYWERVDLGADGAYLMAEIRFPGQADIIYAGASFGTEETDDGVYPLTEFHMGRTYFPSVD